jgi:hypothetical protein
VTSDIPFPDLAMKGEGAIVASTCFVRSIDTIKFVSECPATRYEKDGYADKIYNFDMRDDDVWVISYPKSGIACHIYVDH